MCAFEKISHSSFDVHRFLFRTRYKFRPFNFCDFTLLLLMLSNLIICTEGSIVFSKKARTRSKFSATAANRRNPYFRCEFPPTRETSEKSHTHIPTHTHTPGEIPAHTNASLNHSCTTVREINQQQTERNLIGKGK